MSNITTQGEFSTKNTFKMRIFFHYRVTFYKTAGANFTLRGKYPVCHGETPDEDSFPELLNFTKSQARFWKLKPSRKCIRVFIVCAD